MEGELRRLIFCFVLTFVCLVQLPKQAVSDDVFRIYFDADQTAGASSANAIFTGVKAAFAKNDNRLGQRSVEFVRFDHRGNPKRSWVNLKKAIADENALAVVGGVHSPPYIKYRDQINEAGLVLLLPWSAGSPITRAKDDRNSIFRVSVDDSKAGAFLAKQVLAAEECKTVVFLIWYSGWGRSNLPKLENTFRDAGREIPQHFMFETGLGKAGAREIAFDVADTNADCAIVVANLLEEAQILNELHAADVKLRVFSHWGILLGDFVGMVPSEVRNFLDFQFIQTCALQKEAQGNAVLQALFSDPPIKELEGKSRLSDISSAVGFVNGYDLASILIMAGEKLTEPNDISSQREALVKALQTIDQPVEGILKRYINPFTPYSTANPDAHEALGREDLCMARFTDDGRVTMTQSVNPE